MLSIYKASAGSGKTFALTREYIRMLLSDKTLRDTRLPHSRILAVTFTKKSTAEMKERILKELYILAQTPEKSDYIEEFLNDSNIGLNQEGIQARAKLLMLGILQDYNRFSVSTIDGFFQQIIRTFAIELGLSTNYDLSLDQNEIIHQAVDDIFRRIREVKPEDADLTSWLIEYAQNNIEQNKRWNPIDNIKTFSSELSKETLIQQMDEVREVFADKEKMRSYLEQLTDIKEQVIDSIKTQRDNINQALSTWNKDDINTKCIGIFSKKPEEILVNGFNTSLLNVLEGKGTLYKKTGKSKNEQLILQEKSEEVIKLIRDLYKDITGDVACNYITADAILAKLHSLGILQDVATQIETTNRQLGRLPISEINRLIFQIIDGQESPFIYERIGQYYHHYMIDEFQDTSKLQWQNFKPLILDAEAAGHNNLIVGDVKQSIYRFRNSDWHLLNQVDNDNDFIEKQPGEGMGKNWRTAKVVVENNERLMQEYCRWVVNKCEEEYEVPYHKAIKEIAHIYSYDEMHQKPQKTYDGCFHMQFFEGKHYKERALDTLYEQLQSLQKEQIDLSRVTILTRYTREVETIAQFLIQKGYEVQSAGGLRIGAHVSVQILLALLTLSVEKNDTAQAFLQNALPNFETYDAIRQQAQQLPLYDHVQLLIDKLGLVQWEGATPYLTAFQDKIYQFTQTKVADTQLFLKYWEMKGKDSTIPAPKTNSAINIMTIHSSKGLEFDIVMIPFFDWNLVDSHPNDIIWCKPQTAPFNTIPLVPIHPSSKLLRSLFAEDYIHETLASYTDNLNITYVAITRARYRLYIYGPKYTIGSNKKLKISNVGQLASYLFDKDLNSDNTYISSTSTIATLPPRKESTEKSISSQYVSIPIQERLTLRSRSEDDFDSDAPLAMVDLGILMHLWLSYIRTWEDKDKALQRLINSGQITHNQATEMQKQMIRLQELINQYNHNDWFSDEYKILTEQDIITTSQNTYRPDRVMIKDKHAIIIDYKFGQKQSKSYVEQVRNYILQLREMGYTCEGYIIYNQAQTIQSIQ